MSAVSPAFTAWTVAIIAGSGIGLATGWLATVTPMPAPAQSIATAPVSYGLAAICMTWVYVRLTRSGVGVGVAYPVVIRVLLASMVVASLFHLAASSVTGTVAVVPVAVGVLAGLAGAIPVAQAWVALSRVPGIRRDDT